MQLSAEQMEARTVELLDIAQDSNDHSSEALADPRSFVSQKRQRGPLSESWVVRHSLVCFISLFSEISTTDPVSRLEIVKTCHHRVQICLRRFPVPGVSFSCGTPYFRCTSFL